METASKKNTVKMRSIAWKISADYNFRLLIIFLILDLIFIVMRVELWRIFTETNAMGISLFEADRFRPEGNFIIPKAEDPEEWLKNIRYYIPQIKESVSAMELALDTAATTAVMFAAEFFWIVSGIIRGGRRVRKKLSPLNRLAATTQMISNADFEGDKFHDLENALEKIDASQTDCRVSTGDTELEGIESAINNLIDRMRKSYIQQARFVSDASHELRTPISVIQGYANMLDRWGKEDEKVLEESIAAIKSESESMNKLVEQLLFLARGDNGRQQLSKEEFSLKSMMQELYDEYLMVDSTHRYFLKECPDNVMAYGDYAMIKQTARIITDNAAKYTPEGNDIYLSAYVSDSGIPVFEIQDTGIGIAAADIPKIFERFYRADDARNRKTGGTGLGLSIGKWIIDRHNGYFEVKSYPDAGTKISVFLPEGKPAEKDIQ